MERIYRRNLLTQQLSFKYHYLIDTRSSIGLKLLVWIIIDILLGIIIINALNYIIRLRWVEVLSDILTFYIITLLALTKSSLEWVNNVPIGLKLNNQLTEFIASRFIHILELWEHFYISFLYYYLYSVLSMFSYIKICRSLYFVGC